ncbi:MAG: MG2 domain-containing protein [Armatimonadota bacterium]
MRRVPVLWVVVAGLLGVLIARPVVRAASSALTLREADQAWQERSYAKALEGYQDALAAGKGGPRKDELEYRVAVSLGRTQRWDDALAAAQAFVKSHPDGYWGARGQYWLGQLYTVIYHAGYRVGDRIYRGEDYPKVETAEKPEYVELSYQDRQAAIAAFEAAKRLYEGLRPTAEVEEADLGFDLARVLSNDDLYRLAVALGAIEREKRPELRLQWGDETRPDADLLKRLRGHDWTPTPDKPYDSAQPFPQRILGLLQQIETLDAGRRAAQARLARAMYLAQYQQLVRNWMRAYDTKKKEWVELPFPYQDDDAIALLRSIPADFPKSPVAPQAQLLTGQWLVNSGDFVEALAVYRELVRRWPDSKLVSDASSHIQEIEWPRIDLGVRPNRPGKKAQLGLGGRNVKTIRFAAYRARLEDILLDKALLNDPDLNWNGWHVVVGWPELEKWRRYPKVASWTYTTKDDGAHQHLSETVTTPLTETGAYLVEAQSSEASALSLLVITDLALVQKQDKDRATAFVCNANTGRPVAGAEVVLREVYWKGSQRRVSVGRSQSNPDGLTSKELVRELGSENRYVEAFAWVGDRYAVTESLWGGGRHWGRRYDEYRAYVHTDRPVYRPGQMVSFRIAIAARSTEEGSQQHGQWLAPVDLPFEVTAADPREVELYKATLTTDGFGSINGSLKLPAETTLGEYHFTVGLAREGGRSFQLFGNQFRVEEYKKPEFEVTVEPAKEQARVGEKISAKVNARYYFGSPVVGAQVKYRVFLSPFYPQYRFPRPYDWLIRHWRGDRYGRYYGGRGDVVKEGDGQTNEQGELTVEFLADPGSQYEGTRAFQYSIEAEVTDESRRTINGSGSIRVSKQQYFAFLDLKRGFYQVGDRVELEVMTLDVMERPLSRKGTVIVERVVSQAQNYVLGREHSEVIQTNADGRAFFRWTPAKAGEYRFTFEGKDEWGQQVTAAINTFVHGPDSAAAAFQLSGIQLVPEHETYQLGDTSYDSPLANRTYCKLLIVSKFANPTVLLTQEAGDQIIAKSVIQLKGKTQIVEVPIRPGHEPNFTFRAVSIHEWNAFEAEVEVFVAPARRFLNVSVTSDRADYRPGDKAAFTIKATDWQGKPARAQFSIGVIDASLYYIQQDYAPDPRLAFYGDRRYVNIQQNWSVQWTPHGAAVTDRKHIDYRLHEWAAPEGMGQLQDWPPDVLGEWPPMVYYQARYPFGKAKDQFIPGAGAIGPAGPRGGMGGGRGGGGAGGARAGRARHLGGANVGYAREFDFALAAPPALMPSAESPAAQIAFAPLSGLPLAEEGPLAEAQVRTRFADTAFWSPSVITDDKGEAAITVTMPENLTEWRAVARGFTTDVKVGEGKAEVVTRKDLIVRLQAPRFFMERDLVVLSANVHNYLKTEKRAKVTLALGGPSTRSGSPLADAGPPRAEPRGGGVLELVKDPPAELGLASPATEESLWITVPKDGQARVDWVVRVLRSGTASVRMTAQTDEESDAMEMEFPALVHGVEKFVAQTGAVRVTDGEQTIRLTLDLPKERRRGDTELNLQLSPSLAMVALDSLPYLADYPYGCIEQTISRFLPSAIVARALADQGISLDELHKRQDAYAHELAGVAAGFSPSRQAEARPYPDSAYTYPKGMPGSFDAEKMTRHWPRPPVFDSEELRAMVNAGLNRVYSMQNRDGGWGWFPGNASDPYMTAYACYGLFSAREAGYEIDNNSLERGFQYLLLSMKEDDNLHRMAYVASVLTLRGSVSPEVREVVADRLFRNRRQLTAYSQALLAIALQQLGETDKARTLVDNLLDTAHIDQDNGTCNWMPRQRGWWWWHWWDNPVETNAAALRAIIAVRPDHELAPMIVKWMVANRRGNQWASTKETAFALYALTDYMRAKKELAADYTIAVDLNGAVQRTYRVNRDNALVFDNRFLAGDEVMTDGPQTLTITVKGTGALYYSAYLKYFTLEEDVKGAGNELFVRRRYFRLTPKLVEQKRGGGSYRELTYDREELQSGARLKSGDLIEVELVVESKNDYEYVVFEDMKPAGCEPVEVRSGYQAGEGAGIWPYIELHDEKVAAFLSQMPQGTRAIRYRLRAEIPGEFHALPTNGYSMYAPEVRGLSDEWRVTVTD